MKRKKKREEPIKENFLSVNQLYFYQQQKKKKKSDNFIF